MSYVIKSLLLATIFSVLASAAPQNNQYADIQTVRYENFNDGLGSYHFSYELSDGTTREERGELKNAGTDQETFVVTGSYSWVAPDGHRYTVTFVADEYGFRPEGEHLPGIPRRYPTATPRG